MNRSLIDASTLDRDLTLEADVVIAGTGAGGGFAAETLANAGLKVVLLETGGHYTSATFSQNEGVAMPMLYQQAAAQRTKDQAIAIYQGQAVGGSTVVNWTSSFRTPPETLQHWAAVHGVKQIDTVAMTPYFEAVEQRLNIHEWTEAPPNENNSALARGCQALGLEHHTMRRNVRNCGNTGLCGLGCPLDAKQSMLITTIPAALDKGGVLVYRARAETVIHDGRKASGIVAHALDGKSVRKTGRTITVKARHVIVAAGAIRSPGLLLRSKVPNPSGLLGKRTFLHPVCAVVGVMPDAVNGYKGAPQSIYSDALLWPSDGSIGYKLEVTPLQPLFALVNFDKSFGAAHAALMKRFLNMHSEIALMRDGFDERSPGGTIELRDVPGYGQAEVIDYPLTDYVLDGFRRSMDTMMQIQFAAGASYVLPWHLRGTPLRSLAAARRWLATASFAGGEMMYGSAHVMGGCQMGDDPRTSVVDSYGSHHQIEGLSVFDGSIFPTSIGANPQVSVYSFSLRNSTHLAQQLKAT
jgi:choline dehydrogenase-like flavoprotein